MMMSSGWTCSYQNSQECTLVKKVCEPGMKGCTLYGKALFSNPQTPSNDAYERRREKDERTQREEEMENARFF